jgi:plasmid stabilization system protein ParE
LSLDVEYHPAAAAEVVVAQAWYENESTGLGDRFLAAFEAAVRRAMRWPKSGRPVEIAPDGTIVNRKTPVGGFPWAVGYEVSDDKLIVLAVFHQHRRPDYWTDRTGA